MSTKYLPNLSDAEMKVILKEEDTGCLCMSRNDEPYAVPVSYLWREGEIIFHCAREGLKIDVLRVNPRVCFVVDRHPDRTKPHQLEGECNYRFESVLCFGTARVLDSAAERLEYLKTFQETFYERLGLDPDKNPVTIKSAESCGCVVIKVDRMTGRRKGA